MRCRVGDIAVVIRSPIDPAYIGTLVTVIHMLHPDERGIVCIDGTFFQNHSGIVCLDATFFHHHSGGGGTIDTTWAVRSTGRPFRLRDGTRVAAVPCADSCLRPLRYGEGVGETLRNLGLTK